MIFPLGCPLGKHHPAELILTDRMRAEVYARLRIPR
jgi:hypothetical protein